MKTNNIRWPNPVIREDADTTYTNLYGEDGKCFLYVLEYAPYEIAVVSRLLAYLEKVRGENR